MNYISRLVLCLTLIIYCKCSNNLGDEETSSAKGINSFIFEASNNSTTLSLDVTGEINEESKAINLIVPYATDRTSLIATFITTGVSVLVENTIQLSGNTPNNFIDIVTCTIIAEDNSTQDYLVIVTEESPISLRGLADEIGLYVGAAVDPYYLNESAYAETLSREFNCVVAKNVMKWIVIEPEQNIFDYTEAEKIVTFAHKNDMVIRGHTILWHYQIPDWVKNTPYNELQTVLKNHIDTVLTYYKGEIYAWDVVNEVVLFGGLGLRYRCDPAEEWCFSIWSQDINDDSLIKFAFTEAHSIDPNAKLFINEFNAAIKGDPKADKLYELVSGWLSENIPIHGVGFQLHLLEESPPDMSKIRKNIERYSDLGLEVHFTQIDIRILKSVTEEKLEHQAEIYADLMKIAVDYPNVTANIFWGFTDKYSWISNFFPEYGSPLIFDADFLPKSAYYKIIEVLKNINN